jgi:hypothetical protein
MNQVIETINKVVSGSVRSDSARIYVPDPTVDDITYIKKKMNDICEMINKAGHSKHVASYKLQNNGTDLRFLVSERSVEDTLKETLAQIEKGVI